MRCTAWAITCAVEWRRMFRPSGESIATGSTVSVVVTVVALSLSSPLTRKATTARSGNRSNPVCALTRQLYWRARGVAVRPKGQASVPERVEGVHEGGRPMQHDVAVEG